MKIREQIKDWKNIHAERVTGPMSRLQLLIYCVSVYMERDCL